MKNIKNTFLYRDGGENKLKEIFEDPSFDENTTWRKYAKNWPLLYHLSPERKNLLRLIDFNKSSINILEIGAGCGAITSYFTSLDNKPRIVAIEGSDTRAELIKLRCKNAENLEVINTNIQDYKNNEKYDFVTLIGVLEYAGKYINSTDPFIDLLKIAKNFLKPEGILLIAIENQLGHKYFAGHNEDHYGRPFEGISNYPNYNGIRTFDKTTLHEMLNKCNFTSQQWFYPYPDYKMPRVILSNSSFKIKSFDWLALLNLPTIDYSSKKELLLDERSLLKKLEKNSDVSCFMNSFLICASDKEINIIDPNFIANNMQFSLHKKFQELKNFIIDSDNNITVKCQKFNNGKISTMNIPYYSGYDNIFHLIIDSWKDKKYSESAKYIIIWLERLKAETKSYDEKDINKFIKFTQENIGINIYESSKELIPGNLIDLIPNNCLLNKINNDLKIIDQEWSVNIDIPLNLVVDRGMYYLLLKMKQLTGNEILINDGNWNIPKEMTSHLPLIIKRPNLESLIYFEYWFQKQVRDGDFRTKLDELDNKKIDKIISSNKNKKRLLRIIKIILKKCIKLIKKR